MASVLSTENVNAPTVRTEKFGSGAMVVDAKPIPLLPIEIVLPPNTTLVELAPGPIIYVDPEMIATVGPTVNVRPAAVTTSGASGAAVNFAGATVVEGRMTPLLPMTTVWVPTRTVVDDPAPFPIA